MRKKAKKIPPIDRERDSIVEERDKLESKITDFLEIAGADIADQVANNLKMVAGDMTTEEQVAKVLADIDFKGWSLLIDPTKEALENIYADGTKVALAQINFDASEAMTNLLNQQAADYAEARAAEMVGMKYVDGELVENPNAEWAITDSTRDMLNSTITDSINNGDSVGTLKQNIMDSTGFSEDRARMIARTETAYADQQGNLAAYKESGVVTGKEWVVGSEHDNDDECDDNADAGVIALDDDFPSGDDCPPAHPNCLIGSCIVTASGISKAFKRWFDGEVITLSITGMDKLTVTPNHPILTRSGWIPARKLQKGMELLNCIVPKMILRRDNPKNQYIETSIEQIESAISMSSNVMPVTMITTAEDFHGDGIVNEKVNVIFADSFLKNNIMNSRLMTQKSIKFSLMFTSKWRMLLNTLCAITELLKGMFHTPYCIMGGFSSLCASTGSDSLGLDHSSVLSIPDRQSERMESISQSRTMAADSLAEINRRFSGHISTVKLQDVVISKYSGHVYNLQTKDGYYLAHNGNNVNLFVHNCTCDIFPVVGGEE